MLSIKCTSNDSDFTSMIYDLFEYVDLFENIIYSRADLHCWLCPHKPTLLKLGLSKLELSTFDGVKVKVKVKSKQHLLSSKLTPLHDNDTFMSISDISIE